MKVMGFNGSPRRTWNTATLIQKALEGAASKGAETELIHLYDIDFKGCISCFACKTRESKSYGRCAVRDEMTPVLQEVENCDGIILGSPIYFGTVTGEMRSFMERLLFPYNPYVGPQDPVQTLFPRKINTGFIFTMNVTEEHMKALYGQHLATYEVLLRKMFGPSESLYSFDTYQFEDYSKVVADRWDPEKKARRRKEVFPEDCKKAYEMGARFATKGNPS